MKKSSDLSKDTVRPIGLKNNIVTLESAGELLLYDLKRDRAFCLNETSSMIWNLCDGENTVEDIRQQLSVRLKTQVPDDVVWLALHNLKNEKLLSNCEEIKFNFGGLSRREVIRKIGLATMVALPLISTIAAPSSAAAQSANVCPATTICFCQDASCITFGDLALLQSPCTNAGCSTSGGVNCQCVGRFFCGTTPGQRFGRCGLV